MTKTATKTKTLMDWFKMYKNPLIAVDVSGGCWDDARKKFAEIRDKIPESTKVVFFSSKATPVIEAKAVDLDALAIDSGGTDASLAADAAKKHGCDGILYITDGFLDKPEGFEPWMMQCLPKTSGNYGENPNFNQVKG